MTNEEASRNAAKWADLVSELRSRGKSRRVFAKERGLSVSTLGAWVRRFKQEERASKAPAPSAFSQVSVVPGSAQAPSPAAVLQVTTPQGFVLRVSGEVDPALLETVLQGVSRC